jgi:hypothetical protein
MWGDAEAEFRPFVSAVRAESVQVGREVSAR